MQEGAHALRRQRLCMLDLCRAPQNGETPLHLVMKHGELEVVEMLLEAGAAIGATDQVRGKVG